MSAQTFWSPDGRAVAVSFQPMPAVAQTTVLSLDRLDGVQTVEIQSPLRQLPGVVWSQDSQSLLMWRSLPDGTHELARLHLADSRLETVVPGLMRPGVFSPGGSYALVQRGGDGAVQSIHLTSGRAATLVLAAPLSLDLAENSFWSPDESGVLVRQAEQFTWARADGSHLQTAPGRLIQADWSSGAYRYIAQAADGTLQAGDIAFPSLAQHSLLEGMRAIRALEHPANAKPFDWAALYRPPRQPLAQTVSGFYWQAADGTIGYSLYTPAGQPVYVGTPADMLPIEAEFPPLVQPSPDNRAAVVTSGSQREHVHLLQLESGSDTSLPPGAVEYGAWSPDSVYFAYPAPDSGLHVADHAGMTRHWSENVRNYVPYLGFTWVKCADLVEQMRLVRARGR
jgi:hypothetical protein